MKCIYVLILAGALPALAAAPVMDCPTNIVIDCSKASDPVEFEVTARDDAGQNVPVDCTPKSGSVFALGTHRVVCTASDGRLISTCEFLVEVEDTAPPRLVCPSNLVAQATSAQGAIVTWQSSATDDCGPAGDIVCRPPSGSMFPLGRTAVSCVVNDAAGNDEQCSFAVQVLPPPGLRIARSESNNIVILRWAGNQALQEAGELGPTTLWRDSTLRVIDEGDDHRVDWPNNGLTRFFRLRPVLIPETRDSDGDGVTDSRDRCPGTPPGVWVDAFGCSTIDVVRAPEQLLDVVQKPWSRAAALLARFASETNPPFASADFSGVMRYTDLAATHLNRALEGFGVGDPCLAADAYGSALESWNSARVALEVLIREVEAEWAAQAPRPAEEGDVSSEDLYLSNLHDLAANLDRAQDQAGRTLPAVQDVCRSVEGPGTARGRVVSVNDAERLVKLDSGATVLMPAREVPGNFAEGVLIDVSGLRLNDGSLIGNSVASDVLASPDVLYPKTVFRIAPTQPFPPEGAGPYTLHVPEAYQGIGTRLTLESSMRLGAASIGGWTDGPVSTDTLKLELKYEKDGGGFTTRLAASALKPGDTPVAIPSFFSDKEFLGDEWIVVTLQRKNPTNNSISVVSTTNIPVRIVLRGGVCWANFDQTEFEMVEANEFADLEITHVDSITENSLLFRPVDPGTTKVFEFRNFGGNLRDNTDTFFIFNDWDPSGFEPGVYNDGSVYQKGVNYPVGMTWPRYRGKRNKYAFWYSVGVTPLTRDRVSVCTGTDSFYKLPMQTGWPTWTMGQGNLNPGFTHCPGCYNQYAFDFVAPQNTPILAARGGTVLSFNESRWQNCWNSQTSSCIQNCPGANVLRILHQDGTVGVYMHMPQNSINLSVDQRVYRGDSIAPVGNVGCSSNPHLHFQVDPFQGASLSMQIRFQAYNPCPIFMWPFIVPCDPPDDIRECYIPNRGEILLSTQ